MVRSILLLLSLPLLSQAGDATLDRATLKGIKAASIIIDQLPPDLPKEAVTPDALRTRLTQRLTDAHIPIDSAAKEFVAIRASSVRDAKGPYVVAMSIGLYQPVTLVRNTAMRAAPPTWDVDTVMMAGPKLLYRAAM